MGLDKRILAVFVIILIFAFAGGVKYAEMKQARLSDAEDLTLSMTGEQEEDEENTEPAEKETEIKVYITGEVKNPGVYTFSSGARIYEAIELACPLENAELKYMEMARILKDEETIYVPALGEMEGPQEEILFSASAVDKNGKVNINKASADELTANLNGIGPVLAQRIIDYREANGLFKTIEEIKNVSGIGEKRYADIKEKITVK